ncbi:endonuclease/exonuclease/phosphatase family protein [Simiduia sp. 21SJ11W-1]|uniref:endonuclease/exonuclease/phosphatase family protein n=1 Tax=Simiduia sp. 21SJ11W-1 TaxID=2909669 RepID=UPI00209F345F|nr:endonuclease/exonuclease/phosphatase family protein [Simiduia sp. 21SJ11W-1]UTA47796.1 endonuclease/exonuclease/phosphatase family protein [Simiduia sp. 21SJ11W-1]
MWTDLMPWLGVAILLASLLPLWHFEHWLVRGWDFPRFQVALIASVFVLVQGLWVGVNSWLDGVALGCGLVAVVIQWWWVLPYTPLFPAEVARATREGPALSLMTSNVLMTNRNAEKLLAEVRRLKPDILVTLETDSWWQTQLNVLQADYPHCITCPLDNLYGMHVYSRLALENPEIHFRVEPGVPSMEASVNLQGQAVKLHFLHPAPPSPTENAESTERDAELVRIARIVQHSDIPVIVTGDLNDVAWSATTRLFRKISGLLDPRVGRGMFNTYNAKIPFLRWPLDHIFHSHEFALGDIQRLRHIGSDHFPIYTRLVLNPRENDEDAGLEATPQDRRWAKEKVD